MKLFLSTIFTLLACSTTGSAITVTSPANGAQVQSPFTLVANTSTCSSVPAVSMGYSIDNGQAIIEPTSFSAVAVASQGPHILHIKCWGNNTSSEVLLNITVVPAAPASDITVTSPANGAQVQSPFTLVANTSTCSSVPAVSMGYSIDNAQAIIEPTSFSAKAVASQGPHILHVKCWGNNTSSEVLLNITVVPAAPASDITVTSPANGAQVQSPFTLVANTSTCSSVPAVSMGYSIDNAQAIIEPTSFSAKAVANQGPHILHVKCWGNNTSSEVLLNITVVPGAPTSDITVTSPANEAQVQSPFALVANTSSCGSIPAVSMGYSIDSGPTTIEPTSFGAMAVASQGKHILHVKCWGKTTSSQVTLNITVVAATPVTSDISVTSPANGAQMTSPFNLVARTSTCGSSPALSMGYAIDGGATMPQPAVFGTAVTASPGTHVLYVKCFGSRVSDQVVLNIRVLPSPPAATPKFSLASGQFTTKQIVALSDATPGAVIYYTTDGSGPSLSSAQYAGPISITASTVIEAMAVAPGYSNSGLGMAQYEIIAPKGPTIPANAIQLANIQLQQNWKISHDPGTPGTSAGFMSVVSDPSLSGQAERFDTTFTNGGGELYSRAYAKDATSQNFVYDTQVWIADGSNVKVLEMDNNQVISNGDTVIYGFQCSGWAGMWEYSANHGTPANPVIGWVPSTVPCNPSNWTTNAWHHIQISYSRDAVGHVTYHSVWFDGVEGPISQTVNAAFTLGWGSGVLVTNFQVDGMGASGSSSLYLDNLTISRW